MPSLSTREKIINYIKENRRVSPKELVDYLEISQRAVFKQIKKLLIDDILEKIGTPPKVYYSIKKQKTSSLTSISIASDLTEFINENFYTITPLGIEMSGIEGFQYWCENRKMPLEKMAIDYKRTIESYKAYSVHGMIDGTKKLKATFPSIYIKKLYYCDFYAIERYGKTRLGYMLLYAKQSQSIIFINKIIDIIKSPIKQIVDKHNIDAIGFVPHTVKRDIQIMSICKDKCHFNKHVVQISKIKTPIIIPQKTLSKLDDRVQNAKHTMIVEEKSKFKNVLLIDDAVGSGATIQEISKQLHEKGVCQNNCFGLAIAGSFKGFDVISEV